MDEKSKFKKRKLLQDHHQGDKRVAKKKRKRNLGDSFEETGTKSKKKVKGIGRTSIKPTVDYEQELGSPSDDGLHNESKPTAVVRPLNSQKKSGIEGKTMDYKQFHLKKMKEKWKSDKTNRRRQRKSKKIQGNEPGKQSGVNTQAKSAAKSQNLVYKQFGTCDFNELLHYWNAYAASGLTGIERDEQSLGPKFVFPNKKGQKPSKFFAKRIPDWKEWLKRDVPNGSPQIIILCPSDIRAVELNRELAEFKGDGCRSVKLIPKEKAQVQAELLKKHKVHLVVGTPHRIRLLIDHSSLKLDDCRVIALDWSYQDPKKRRLITIPELRLDVLKLFHKYFVPLFQEREEVALFML